jgi:predicted amidohydrolase
MRARAIESGAFVVAAAQTGVHEDGRTTYGHSLVVDPWGDVLLDMGEAPGLGYVGVDPARIADVRGRIPVLDHRRPIPPAEQAP